MNFEFENFKLTSKLSLETDKSRGNLQVNVAERQGFSAAPE